MLTVRMLTIIRNPKGDGMDKSFHHTLMKAYFSFHRMVMEQARSEGLTSGQPKILEFLLDGDGVEQKVIAAHCEIESATAGSILNRMESAGLIERRRLDGNRRSIYVYLTDSGKKAAERIKEIFAEAEMRAFDGIPTDEREILCRDLKKIYANTVGTEKITW